MRLNFALTVALLLVPLGPAAATMSITRTVTKTATVRTTTVAFRRLYRPYIVRRFHPEWCYLTPDQVVELNALGPYCDSPRGWQPRGYRWY